MTSSNASVDTLGLNITSQVYYLPEDTVIGFITGGTIASVGFIVNFAVLIMLFRVDGVKSAADALVAHLALSDLLSTIPILIIATVVLATHTPGWSEYYIDWACKLLNFGLMTFYFSTIGTLTLMSIERYRAIIHPLKPRINSKQTAIILLSMWILITIMPGIMIPYNIADVNYSYVCVTKNFQHNYLMIIASIYFVVFGYLIPGSIMLYCYTKIIKRLRQTSLITSNKSSVKTESRGDLHKKRVIKTLIAVSFTFSLTGIPLIIALISNINVTTQVHTFTSTDYQALSSITFLFSILLLLSPLYNPLIYLAKKKPIWSCHCSFNPSIISNANLINIKSSHS